MLPGGHVPKITRLSKALSSLLVILFAVNYFVPETAGYLALVPGRTLPCVWNLVTAGFLTTNVFKLVAELLALILLARLVEPVYGSKEFLKFIFVVDFTTCLSVFVCVYITYAATAYGDLLYIKFHGFHGIAAGLLVAVKQVMQDQDVTIFGSLKFSIRYLPMVVILIATAVAVALQDLYSTPFIYLGAYSAWLYLRFFQYQPNSEVQGDASDAFKFSSCFPPFLAVVIDPIAAVLGVIFRLKHAPPSEESQSQLLKPGASLLGSDVADSNRRRERGAKALEERLGMKMQSSEDVENGEEK
jgi:membrane associated rhomboid family serine protease